MSVSSPQTILRRLGLRPEKARGQHFLIHPHQARRIVAALELVPQETVVEVGPGLGALTGFLVQEAGLEWAWRLSKEPGRLWHRYLRYNPLFVKEFARQWAENRRSGSPAGGPASR